MDVFLMVRRKKTTIFLDAKETTTVVMIAMIMVVASKLLLSLWKQPETLPELMVMIMNTLFLFSWKQLNNLF